MNRNKRTVNQYLRKVRGHLPCNQRLKRQVLAQIKGSIEQYLKDHPDADLAAIQAHFGTPQQIAAAYINDLDANAILRQMKYTRKVVSIVGLAMVVLLLMQIGAEGMTRYYEKKAQDIAARTDEVIGWGTMPEPSIYRPGELEQMFSSSDEP